MDGPKTHTFRAPTNGWNKMKARLLDFLCCPDCRHEKLDLAVYGSEGNGESERVMEGEIRCGRCGSRFPVINGVPRMLPVSLRRHLVRFHPDFFRRYPELTLQARHEPPDETVARTLEGYSYQYMELEDRQKEIERWKNNFLSTIPVRPDFFKRKIGADIGCGSGRHLHWAHEFGAEVVGVDLSEGVEVANTNTAECPHCHVVQGDIYHLPFKKGIFDFAYSIGVLHHLPNPREGFRRILPSVKQGGRTFIWVYGLHGMRLWYRLSHMTWLRGIACRLPRRGQYLVSILLASLLELVIWMPCRIVSIVPGGGSIVARVPLGDACRRSFRAKIRSVFDRVQPAATHYLTADELEDWLKDAGLTNTSVTNRDGRGWIASGVKV